MTDGVDDPRLEETAQLVERVLRAGQLRPAFRDRLRAELVAARAESIATGATAADQPATGRAATDQAAGPAAPAPTGDRVDAPPARVGAGRRWRRPAVIGWVGAATAAVAASAVILAYALPGGHGPAPVTVSVSSDLAGAVSADPAASLRLRFSSPLNPDATRAALRLTPAAAVRSTWDDGTLTVTPVHGFAPNVAYVLTIDHEVARTAGGAALAADLHVAFGTASVAGPGPATGRPASLFRKFVAAADGGAEAPVTRNGELLVTSARASNATGQRSGLLRIGNTTSALAGSTDAICVSRGGNSVAYRAGHGIVFADADGLAQTTVPVNIDEGSPLGWIGDTEVTFVGGGKLRAVSRTGAIRTLAADAVDLNRDGVDIAPGGRWVYLRHGGAGQLVDIQTGAAHALAGIAGDPTFSADGASVFWIDQGGHLASAASGGGPVRTVALPISAGDVVSDVAVSPVGSRFVYSVTHPDGRAEVRLAALPDGDTLAVDTDGAGESPNWAPSGQFFTVLASSAAGSQIQSVSVPSQLTDRQASLEAAAGAFADAQLSSDPDAQRALAAPGVALVSTMHATRAAVLWVQANADGTATARIRLTADAAQQDPVARQVEETLTLGAPSGTGTAGGPPVVLALQVESARPAPTGPQVTNLDTDAQPGTVLLTFDSDLDPASIDGATLAGPGGTPVPATASYDAASRTVRLRPGAVPAGPVVLVVGTGLRDVDGHRLAEQLRVPVTLR
jgi:hypothetical protein